MKIFNKSFGAALITGLVATAIFSSPATAQQQPYLRFNMGGYNPETGLGGRMTGGYNPSTGARGFRMSGYDAELGQFESRSRYMNPSTGEGFTSTTTGTRGQGLTTQVNTMQNGSFTCFGSRNVVYNCTQNGEGL